MIVPMKKYAFLVFHRDLDQFLPQLQSFGMVDITRRNATLEAKDKEMLAEVNRYAVATRKLKGRKLTQPPVTCKPFTGKEALDEYESLIANQEQTSTLIKIVEKELQDALIWGNFNPDDVQRLQMIGITPHFFTAPRKRFSEEWQQQYPLVVLNEDSTNIYFIVLQEGNTPINIEAQEMKVPSASANVRQEELDSLQQIEQDIKNRLDSLTACIGQMENAKAELMSQIDYTSVKQSAEGQAENNLLLFTGWIPKEHDNELVSFLDTQDMLYLEQAIEQEDRVPIKLKNGWFAKLFEPITEMYSLPNYRELDLTPFFAPFYMMFFGFCFGDAGYGLLLILICFFIKRKLKKEFRPFVSLIQWLCLAACIFGALTGTFFGVDLAQIELLTKVKTWFVKDDNTLMALSIALGALQVLVGMGIHAANIARQQGFKYAISKIAWMVFIVVGAVTFGLPMLGIAIPQLISHVLYGIIGISALFIFFYNSPGKNPLLNFGVGIWDSFNTATGLLGDLLSYIRLFALGLTGGVLGGAFNSMAQSLSPDIPVVGFLVTLFILVLGHGINIMLSMLGAIIHPIRLTYVEFFKNSGYEGGGIAYKPFKYNKSK